MCQFCRTQGRHVYEANREGIKEHYRKSHFMCEAPECVAEGFAVFANAIDLNDHYIHFHGKEISAAELEQIKENSGYISLRDNQEPTQFTINRRNTRETFVPNSTSGNKNHPISFINTLISFPELPRTRVPVAKVSPEAKKRVNTKISDKIGGKINSISFPPLPKSNLAQNIKTETKKTRSKTDIYLDRLIKGGNESTKKIANSKKFAKIKRFDMFDENKPKPIPFSYEQLPERHANLHKRLKQLGGSAKFKKFRELYFKFTAENLPAEDFCYKYLSVFGVNEHSMISLYEIVRLITIESKSDKLYKVCLKTDFSKFTKKNIIKYNKSKSSDIFLKDKFLQKDEKIEKQEKIDNLKKSLEDLDLKEEIIERIDIENLYSRKLQNFDVNKNQSFFKILAKFFAMELIVRLKNNQIFPSEDKLKKLQEEAIIFSNFIKKENGGSSPNLLAVRKLDSFKALRKSTAENVAGVVDIYRQKKSSSFWLKHSVELDFLKIDF
ncbi:hypothetical protein MHBO_001310 [Bonamia ostreae]|uniref:C2H2-type domain-containing protein n=1 Tax=Bonamia ostreae TaxID=126728 RepID=A0ABV2AII4_9EUKA